jgi:hypothetical protein
VDIVEIIKTPGNSTFPDKVLARREGLDWMPGEEKKRGAVT